jgi:hypothetical protein
MLFTNSHFLKLKSIKKSTLFFFLVILFANGCSEDIPSVADGRKFLETYVEKEGCLKMAGFEKTNAQKIDAFGMKMYVMEYSADYVFTATCYVDYDVNRKKYNLGGSPRRTLSQLEIDTRLGKPKQLSTGEKITITGKLDFAKKENGWVAKCNSFEGC